MAGKECGWTDSEILCLSQDRKTCVDGVHRVVAALVTRGKANLTDLEKTLARLGRDTSKKHNQLTGRMVVFSFVGGSKSHFMYICCESTRSVRRQDSISIVWSHKTS